MPRDHDYRAVANLFTISSERSQSLLNVSRATPLPLDILMRSSAMLAAPVLALLLLLSACNKPTAEPSPVTEQPASGITGTVPPTTASAAVAAPLASAGGLMIATPGSATCEPRTDVTFTWDVTKQGTANVEIWVGEAAPDATMFASGGPSGKQSSGPWVVPGTVFVLRDAADKSELDRLTIGGVACPKPVAVQ